MSAVRRRCCRRWLGLALFMPFVWARRLCYLGLSGEYPCPGPPPPTSGNRPIPFNLHPTKTHVGLIKEVASGAAAVAAEANHRRQSIYISNSIEFVALYSR